jgi:hypothetical protein
MHTEVMERLTLQGELQRALEQHEFTIQYQPRERVPLCGHPLTTSAWLMLQRNLLYTAVTRAKRLVVLVGSRRALAKAVRTQGAGRRYTALTERLQQRRARTVAVVSRPWDGQLQQVPVELRERVRDRVRPAGRSG